MRPQIRLNTSSNGRANGSSSSIEMQPLKSSSFDDEDDEDDNEMFVVVPTGYRKRRWTILLVLLPCTLLFVTAFYFQSVGNKNNKKKSIAEATNSNLLLETITNSNYTMVPQDLLDRNLYSTSDFVNSLGIQPVGWERPNADPNVWGPCRFTTPRSINWNESSKSNSHNDNPEHFIYQKKRTSASFQKKNPNANNGWCRPGFLIIGAGKCGTSSLYHYLVGHPRVLPAIEKQVHYFKYHDNREPLEWYYGYFPTPYSFLSHGGLVTGEASPGYLPYPAVARNAYKAWKGTYQKDGAGVASQNKPLANFLIHPDHQSWIPTHPPKIVVVGRNPMDRIYSSYKYNYVVPTLQLLRKYGHPNPKYTIEKNHKDDAYYEPYLFTLEEFIRAELKQLRGCLYDWGPQKTYQQWSRDGTYKEAIQLRNGPYKIGNVNTANATANSSKTNVPPPLIDLDGICYGGKVSKTVHREQWKEMIPNNPQKYVMNRNLHLTQAFIGRSLYVYPLEWWYLNFVENNKDSDDTAITFVCTEDLAKAETLIDLTARLGLPEFDGFDEIVAKGAYNVGGHRGYDEATSWEELEKENNTISTTKIKKNNNDQTDPTMTNGIPLSKELYQELKEFIKPHNERLFALTGKRCDW